MTASNKLIYGDSYRRNIRKGINYILNGKNTHWNMNIFHTIDRSSIGSNIKKMSVYRVTNGVKMAHGWQHDGYQKFNFNDNTEELMCPTGFGKIEDKMHFVSCSSTVLIRTKQA